MDKLLELLSKFKTAKPVVKAIVALATGLLVGALLFTSCGSIGFVYSNDASTGSVHLENRVTPSVETTLIPNS